MKLGLEATKILIGLSLGEGCDERDENKARVDPLTLCFSNTHVHTITIKIQMLIQKG